MLSEDLKIKYFQLKQLQKISVFAKECWLKAKSRGDSESVVDGLRRKYEEEAGKCRALFEQLEDEKEAQKS